MGAEVVLKLHTFGVVHTFPKNEQLLFGYVTMIEFARFWCGTYVP